MNQVALLSSISIEEYSNYRKDQLYSRKLILKNKENSEEKEIAKIIFPDYLEDSIIKEKLAAHQISRIENIDTIDKLPFSLQRSDVTEDEIKKRSLLVYEFFDLTKEEWDKLECDFHSSLYFLYDHLEDTLDHDAFQKILPHKIMINTLVKLIQENIKDLDEKVKDFFNRFLSFSIQKQDLIFLNVMNW